MPSIRENRCHRFQANIFNKSKCQNCFKTRDTHALNEADLYRKWQRRFFVLFEHGLLRYALDDTPGTMPQDTLDMLLCCEVFEASSRTGFSNTLCLSFTERDYYIRTESADDFRRWRDSLLVHPKSTKSSQRKRTKDPSSTQLGPNNERDQTCISDISTTTVPSVASKSGNAARVAAGVDRNVSKSGYGKNSDGGSAIKGSKSTSVSATCKRKDSFGAGVKSKSKGCSSLAASSYSNRGKGGAVASAVEGGSVHDSERRSVEEEEEEEEEQQRSGRVGDLSSISSRSAPVLNTSSYTFPCTSPLTEMPQDSQMHDCKDRAGVESGYSSLEKTQPEAPPTLPSADPLPSPDPDHRRSEVISHFEKEHEMTSQTTDPSASSSSSSSSSVPGRHNNRAQANMAQELGAEHFVPDHAHPSACRRQSKSLERTPSEPTSTPDLLNFKKGWMTRLGEDGKWRKHWFVLTDRSLRFYRDSVAEEAADLDGEINLSTCYDVTDFPVERNYGFQIHTKDGVFTLCTMTSGTRRNWIQAVMKNVCSAIAPDVTWKNAFLEPSSVRQKTPNRVAFGLRGQALSEPQPSEGARRGRSLERQEGQYKIFDWMESSRKQLEETSSKALSKKVSDPALQSCGSLSTFSSSASPGPVVNSVPEATESETAREAIQERSLCLETPSMTESDTATSISSSATSNHAYDVHAAAMAEEKEKQVCPCSSHLPASTLSSSVQTDAWQWEEELQSLCQELNTERQKNEALDKEFKLSETRLQADLIESQKHLSEAQSRVLEAESRLKDREETMEELQGRLDVLTARLKATEEAQALKEVRLQRHLRLLQESQERERKSLTDSLNQSEQRGRELEARLQQQEADLQRRSGGNVLEELERRCHELQNQLEESDCEVSRLQARLQTEETLYYDMEHDYEQVCEELERVRGELQDCERRCEERYESQLNKKQQDLDKKERDLQEVLVKMAVLGSSLEETERKLQEAQELLQESSLASGRRSGSQKLFKVLDIRQRMKPFGPSVAETQRPTAQGEESERVISVIQALERKLCDTEERLREITEHLQQQQLDVLTPDSIELHIPREHPCWSLHDHLQCSSIQAPDRGCFSPDKEQGKRTPCDLHDAANLSVTSNGYISTDANGNTDNQGGQQTGTASPERQLSVGMTGQALLLTALTLERMATVLENPSAELRQRLSELHIHACEQKDSPATWYMQLLSTPLAQHEPCCLGDLTECILGESEICALCVQAELAFIAYAVHTRSSEAVEQFCFLPWAASAGEVLRAREEPSHAPSRKLADISPPELAPYVEQINEDVDNQQCGGDTDLHHSGRESLVAELHAQAQSLQCVYHQFQSEDGNGGTEMPKEFPPAVLRNTFHQVLLIYVICRQRLALQGELFALREQREHALRECQAMCRSMEALFQEQTERYEAKLGEERSITEMAEQGRVRAEAEIRLKAEELQKLEAEFETKLSELQRIHEEEMSRLHEYYIRTKPQACSGTLSDQAEGSDGEPVSIATLKDRIRELEAEVSCMKELGTTEGNSVREAYQRDLENLKATCERSFSIMEQTHQKVIEEMQRQHQQEVEHLTEEKERVLQEETSATIAAIEAMRKAHKEELEKSQRAQRNGANRDINQLRALYDEELQSLHRELGVLSEQYSQKCLENAHLSKAIEVERQTLAKIKQENQELHLHNQELNKCLVSEISLVHSSLNGEQGSSSVSQDKDLYQLEVSLRVKDSEVQYLKQEISSLKEELQTADKHSKELYAELNVMAAKSQRVETPTQTDQRCDLMKSRSNPDFLKDRPSHTRSIRSKSLKDGLSVQEKMKLFESLDSRKI